MKKLALGFFLACLVGMSLPASAQVQVGVSVGAGGDSFHLALGNYYHAPPDQIVLAQQRHIPDEEMPVAFFIAGRAHVAPGVIINLRGQGMGWGAIVARYRLSPRIFYVPIRGSVVGTPYEGFYRGYRGRNYRMADAEIVNMVNLRFASEYYHKPAEEVIRLRAGGRNFRDIHEQYHPHQIRRDDHRDDHRDNRRDDHHDDRDDHHDDHRDWH